jgi:hypothetical protein
MSDLGFSSKSVPLTLQGEAAWVKDRLPATVLGEEPAASVHGIGCRWRQSLTSQTPWPAPSD